MNEFERNFLKQMLRSRKHEARGWLEDDPKRNLGEMKRKPSVALVRNLYGAGAVEVLAVDIKDDPMGESVSDLLVKLPDDAQPRERLFALQREMAEPQGFEGDADEGQEYLYFKLC